jgi:hypothetical protein
MTEMPAENTTLEAVKTLLLQWATDVNGYPDTTEANWAGKAVALCATELAAAVGLVAPKDDLDPPKRPRDEKWSKTHDDGVTVDIVYVLVAADETVQVSPDAWAYLSGTASAPEHHHDGPNLTKSYEVISSLLRQHGCRLEEVKPL